MFNDGSRGKEKESEDEDNRTLGGALEKEREKERELGWNRRTRCKLLQAIFVSYVKQPRASFEAWKGF